MEEIKINQTSDAKGLCNNRENSIINTRRLNLN